MLDDGSKHLDAHHGLLALHRRTEAALKIADIADFDVYFIELVFEFCHSRQNSDCGVSWRELSYLHLGINDSWMSSPPSPTEDRIKIDSSWPLKFFHLLEPFKKS